MTNVRIALRKLLEKSSGADSLREMIGFAAQRRMALEAGTFCGAAHASAIASTKERMDRNQ